MYDFQKNNSCVDFGVKKKSIFVASVRRNPMTGRTIPFKDKMGSVPGKRSLLLSLNLDWIWWSSIAWFLADLNVHCAAGIECKQFGNADTLTKPF